MNKTRTKRKQLLASFVETKTKWEIAFKMSFLSFLSFQIEKSTRISLYGKYIEGDKIISYCLV